MSMPTSGWIIKQFDLAVNTVESNINNKISIYTTPKAVLQAVERAVAQVDEQLHKSTSIEYINYTILKNELTIGHILYMKPNDYKIIYRWNNTNYIAIVRVQINSVE